MTFNRNQRLYIVFLWFYSILAGIILSFAFPPRIIPHIQWLVLVPFFFLLVFPMRRRRDVFFFGWLAGVSAFGVYLFWFFDAIPLNWLGFSNLPVMYALVTFAWLLAITYFGIFFGVYLFMVKKFGDTAFKEIIFMALLWPVLEYVRTALYPFHPFILGPGNIFGDNAGFLLLGTAAAGNFILRPLASFLGSYGLGLTILLPNVILFLFLRSVVKKDFENLKKNLSFLILVFVFIGFLIYGRSLSSFPEDKGENINIAIIQTNFTPEDWVVNPSDYVKKTHDLASSLYKKASDLNPSPQIIVMPEGVPLIDTKDQIAAISNKEITEKIGNGPYRLLISSPSDTVEEGRRKNLIALIDNKSGLIGVYEKRFLMPWGEYLPYISSFGARVFGASGWFSGNFIQDVPGNNPGVFKTPLGVIGTLSCSEILSPKLMRETAAGGAEIIIFSASEGILRGSKSLFEQNLAIAKLHASEIQKPIIYDSNGGHSFVVDAKGEVTMKSDETGNNIFTVNIQTNDKKTFATKYPNWILFASGFILILMIIKNKKLKLAAAIVVLLIPAFLSRGAIAEFAATRLNIPDAIISFSGNANRLMRIGNYYFNGGAYNLETAKKAYKKSLAIDPKIPEGHYLLGRIAFIEGDFQTAFLEINREIELRPEFPNSYYVHGLISGYVGNFKTAVQDFSLFVDKVPTQWAGYNDLAWVQTKLGNFKEAKKTVESALEVIPGEKKRNSWLWTSLGVAQLNLKEYDKAKESFLTALAISDHMGADYFWSAYPGNDPKNAKDAFRQFLSTLHFNLAVSLEKLGRREEAAKEYGKSLGFTDENSSFQKNITDKIRSLKR